MIAREGESIERDDYDDLDNFGSPADQMASAGTEM